VLKKRGIRGDQEGDGGLRRLSYSAFKNKLERVTERKLNQGDKKQVVGRTL